MKILIVGGAVRDILLNKKPNDIDYLVQGVSSDVFLSEFPSAKQVGIDFPVFLYKGEEYAFARIDRKTGIMHTDFTTQSKGVSVEEDLRRRDLTINSIAMCPEDGTLICDPQCLSDLKNKIIRHTSSAFIEDPLRVLRVARFACQLPDFTVAQETIQLMKSIKDQLKYLSEHRVFKELEKALSTDYPGRFFEILREADCLSIWFPEIENLIGVSAGPDKGKHKGEVDCFDHTMRVIERMSNATPIERFAGLCHDLGKALSENPPAHHNHDKVGVKLVQDFCDRLRVPTKYRNSAIVFTSEHIRMHRIQEMKAGKAVRLLLKAEKCMTGGLISFLKCSMGDGTTQDEVDEILRISEFVFNVRLPEKYYGRGKVCGEILLNLQAHEWKRIKNE